MAQDVVVDGNLISGQHPGVVDKFLDVFLTELEKKELTHDERGTLFILRHRGRVRDHI